MHTLHEYTEFPAVVAYCFKKHTWYLSTSLPASLLFGRSRLLLCSLLPIYILFSDFSKILTSADQHSAQTTHFWEKEDSLPLSASSLHSGDRKTQLPTLWHRNGKENTSCGIYMLHELLQRIVVLETKFHAGLPKQVEHTADRHHGPPQNTAGESCESSESQQFIPSVEEQAETDQKTNQW